MQRRFEDKRLGLMLAFLALISLVLLAGALRTMSFHPGQPIGSSDSDKGSLDLTAIVILLVEAAEVPFWQQITSWGILFVIVLLVSTLLSPDLRKKLIRAFLQVATFAIIFFMLIKRNPDVLTSLLLNLQTFNELGVVPSGQEVDSPVFYPPQIPAYLSFIITLGIILLSIVLLWSANRWWQKRKELMSAHQPLKEIGDIARLSLKDLESGEDSRDAIIQCYNRMSQVVDVKRGLYRDHSMTPAEFVTRLEKAGLPRRPVTQLTRLFESVRYGGHVSDAAEINEAKTCLTSILKYCGELQ